MLCAILYALCGLFVAKRGGGRNRPSSTELFLDEESSGEGKEHKRKNSTTSLRAADRESPLTIVIIVSNVPKDLGSIDLHPLRMSWEPSKICTLRINVPKPQSRDASPVVEKP